MSDQHLEYASKIPKEVRLAIDGLSGQNEMRYAVMMLLVEEGGLKFSQMKRQLDLHPQQLANALDSLERGGLVKKEPGERIGDQSTGQYEITTFGDRILDGLYEASKPGTPIEENITRNELIEAIRNIEPISTGEDSDNQLEKEVSKIFNQQGAASNSRRTEQKEGHLSGLISGTQLNTGPDYEPDPPNTKLSDVSRRAENA